LASCPGWEALCAAAFAAVSPTAALDEQRKTRTQKKEPKQIDLPRLNYRRGILRHRSRHCSEELTRWFYTGASSTAAPIHLTEPTPTNTRTETKNRKTEKGRLRKSTKSDSKLHELSRFGQKKDLLGSKLFPKNHSLGLFKLW